MRKVGAMREDLGNEGLVLYSVLSHLFEILMIQKGLFSFAVQHGLTSIMPSAWSNTLFLRHLVN